MARQQARRRNLERLAGIGLAVLGLVVLAVAVFAIRNPRNGTPAAAAPSSSPSSTAVHPTSSAPGSLDRSLQPTDTVPITAGRSISLQQARQVPLVVLNNTTTNGLAAQAAQRFRSAGWNVTSIGNLVNNIRSTCAYYAPSHPKAKAAAMALRREFPAIKRVRPKFPQLPAGPIVVVLAPDYAPQ